MKLVALPDLHHIGIKLLPLIASVIKTVDWIILSGDITNGKRGVSMAEMLQSIADYNPNILAVPGNWEYLADIDVLTAYNANLHGTHRIINEIAFYGAGGSLPFIGSLEFTEAEYATITQEAVQELAAGYCEVFVCHNPPFHTINDYTNSGKHVGSHAIRKFIEQRQPAICFTGHIHEGTGIDTIGKTQIINPGPIWQNRAYAYAEITSSGVDVLEIRKF